MRADFKEIVLNGKLKFLLQLDAVGNNTFRASLQDNRTFTWGLHNKAHRDDTGAMYYVVAVVLLYGLSIIFMIASVIKKSKQDHGLSKYMRDLDKVKRLERRQEKFKTRMAMQKKRGRYAKTARPDGMQHQSRLFHHDLSRRELGHTGNDDNILMPSLSELYQSPKDRPLIMPIITVKEPTPSLSGTPAPWTSHDSHFQFPPYNYIHGSYHKRTVGDRKVSVRISPSVNEESTPCSLDTLEEEEYDVEEEACGEIDIIDESDEEDMSENEYDQLLLEQNEGYNETTRESQPDEGSTIIYRTDFV